MNDKQLKAWNVGDEVGVEGDSSVGMNDWKGTITFIKDDYAIVKDEQGEEEEIMLRSLYKIEESVNEGQGEYYAEKEGNDWGVFNTDSVGKFASGHCFALFSDKQQADDKAKEEHEKIRTVLLYSRMWIMLRKLGRKKGRKQ